MGISHLETYLHKYKNQSTFCMDVNIQDMVETFKNETKSDDVTLVVDGNCFLYEQYDFKNYDWCMGGQLLVWTEQVDKFIKKFQELGVRLVFYFDGSITESKINMWISRQQQSVIKHNKIFEWLKENASTDLSHDFYESDTMRKMYLLPAMIGACGRFLLKYYFNCEVHVSVGDCDREMANFAKDKKCFAIMSQDTDFLVFEGARYYLSMRFFNLDEMKTICYDGKQLASSLSLQTNQLPLFASLIGNDYVSIYELRTFHWKICKPSEGNFKDICVKVPHVADFVRKQPTGEALIKKLPKISLEVFGRNDMIADLKTSIQSYETGKAVTLEHHKFWDVLDTAFQKHVNCEIFPTLYPILLGKPYELKMSLEDFSSSLPAVAIIYLPLRQKMYSILLHDVVLRGTSTVEEWCVLSEDISNIPQCVPFIHENDSLHPGLKKLWSIDAEMDSIRWEIFAKSISPKVCASDLQNIPLQFVVPAVTLHFLLKDKRMHLLRRYEIDGFISQVVIMKHSTIDDLKAIETLPVPSVRMVHISTVIGRGITTVLLLMASCGFSLENVMPWLYYDGRLFQKQYIAAEKGKTKLELLNNQTELLSEYELIRNIAFNGKLLKKCSSGKTAGSKSSVSTQQCSPHHCKKRKVKEESHKESRDTSNIVSNVSQLSDTYLTHANNVQSEQQSIQNDTNLIQQKRKRNRNRNKKPLKQEESHKESRDTSNIVSNEFQLSDTYLTHANNVHSEQQSIQNDTNLIQQKRKRNRNRNKKPLKQEESHKESRDTSNIVSNEFQLSDTYLTHANNVQSEQQSIQNDTNLIQQKRKRNRNRNKKPLKQEESHKESRDTSNIVSNEFQLSDTYLTHANNVQSEQQSIQNDTNLIQQKRKRNRNRNKKPLKQAEAHKEHIDILNMAPQESLLSGTYLPCTRDVNSTVDQQCELQTEQHVIKPAKRNRNRKKKSGQDNHSEDVAGIKELTNNVSSLTL